MNSFIKCSISFALGAAASAVALNFLYKKKYEKEITEEIEKTRAHFAQKSDYVESETKTKTEIEKKPDVEKLENVSIPDKHFLDRSRELAKQEMIDYTSMYGSAACESMSEKYIEYIPPDEVGKIANDADDFYDVIDLDYNPEFRTVSDSNGSPVSNWKDRLGELFMTHYGEYEDDCVYIRNHQVKADYRVTLMESMVGFYDEKEGDALIENDRK